MTEDDDLKDIFRSEPVPPPREGARAVTITVAMARFDEKNRAASQGAAIRPRLRDRVRGLIRGSHKMQSLKLSHVLMAGTSLAVLSIAVLNVGQLYQPKFDLTVADKKLDETLPRPESKDEERLLGDEVIGQLKIVPAEQAPEMPAQNKAKTRTEALQTEVDARQDAPATDALTAQSGAAAGQQFVPQMAEPLPSRNVSGVLAKKEAGGMLAAAPPAADADGLQSYYQDQGRDKFADIETNPVKITAEEPVSTFSTDVDTASYSFVRGSFNNNVLPQKDAVRVEEMINYFPYDYAGPADRSVPFKANVAVFPTPWNAGTQLMRIGIKGFALNGQEKPKANLVFLLDTSGSMDSPDKLPLLQNAMKMLVDTLGPEDTVSIVTYAGSAGTVLEPTKARDKAKIVGALDRLGAGGSTAGAEGIRQAYQLAEQSFDRTGVNRVILATDGDFNVGITDPEELKSFVERKRDSGITLSVLGFGRGNYNDETMQVLAQNGNGNASYIDTLSEARKVLVDEASSTLFTIAQDVKIQVEFNPQQVSEYRLIGYETRMLKREDFNNDKVDAGDIGSGHTVTALYELTPRNSAARLNDDLRYAKPAETAPVSGGEFAFVKIRYKLPGESQSKLITEPVKVSEAAASLDAAPQDARFAAAVAGFGQLLRGGQYTKTYSYDDVIALAQGAKGADPFGYRAEFINLARIAKTAQGLEPLK
ncbi:VWA domain-containing protein [soil metagenome]